MDRGTRREINHRKWVNKLKKLYNSHSFDYCCRKVKQKRCIMEDYYNSHVWHYDNWKELTTDIWGVLHKHTRTMYRDNKRLDIKEERTRNLRNRKLTRENYEDILNFKK